MSADRRAGTPELNPTASAPIFEKGEPLEWGWEKFGTTDWILTGVSMGLAVSSYALRGVEAKRQGGVLLDEEARDIVRLPTLQQRQIARDVSDVLLSLRNAFPFLVDSLIITYWHRTSGEAAWQMALIDLQTIAVTAAIQGLTSALAARERPYGRDCGWELNIDSVDCENFNRNTSFFSGHASLAFTLAGLVCTHHTLLPINVAPFSYLLPCSGTMPAAPPLSLPRMLGDMHYLSDVVTGAAVGILVGFGVPWLLHYRNEASDGTDLSIQIVPSQNGASLVGTF